MDETDSPYDCPTCHPFCGCGSCGECMGAPTPRCWKHEPLTVDEITESRVAGLLAYEHNSLEFDDVCRRLLGVMRGYRWVSAEQLASDRAEFVRTWNNRQTYGV